MSAKRGKSWFWLLYCFIAQSTNFAVTKILNTNVKTNNFSILASERAIFYTHKWKKMSSNKILQSCLPSKRIFLFQDSNWSSILYTSRVNVLSVTCNVNYHLLQAYYGKCCDTHHDKSGHYKEDSHRLSRLLQISCLGLRNTRGIFLSWDFLSLWC